ncbi:MAG TPA: pilus assembly protein TadG-related protein [Acidimicrobiia bacterium]|nr:pilus assembly protein TadG-related protein [Acidimicrobiia bacterium]
MIAGRARREGGQAAVLLLGVLALAVVFVALAVDGARLLTVRRDLHAVADSAALAGASAIDEHAYRETVGHDIRLDAQLARDAAERVLAASGLPEGTTVQVDVDETGVDVRITRDVPTVLLRTAGLTSERIGAHARAEPRRL